MISTLDTARPVAACPPSRRLRALVAAVTGWPGARARKPHPVHELPSGRSLTLRAPLGQRVECLAGCIWITLDGDPRDFIVEAGQAFTADHDRRALIQALEASQLRVTGPSR